MLVGFFSLWCSICSLIVHADEIELRAPAVAYQPKGRAPGMLELDLNESQIRTELRMLRKIGFRGIVTYGSDGIMGRIPEFARSEKFDGTIIMGIWDILSSKELANAISQASSVDGYCLGNEGLGVRYNVETLLTQMKWLRTATGLPVTTSEPIFKYFQPKYKHVLCEAPDWVFPIIHPFWNQPFEPEQAAQWTIVHFDYLSAVTGRSIIIKEAGFPSAGHAKLNEEAQIIFFQTLARSGIPYFHFEAFDQPWKINVLNNPEIEAHWGLFNADGTPKKIIGFLTEQWNKQ